MKLKLIKTTTLNCYLKILYILLTGCSGKVQQPSVETVLASRVIYNHSSTLSYSECSKCHQTPPKITKDQITHPNSLSYKCLDCHKITKEGFIDIESGSFDYDHNPPDNKLKACNICHEIGTPQKTIKRSLTMHFEGYKILNGVSIQIPPYTAAHPPAGLGDCITCHPINTGIAATTKRSFKNVTYYAHYKLNVSIPPALTGQGSGHFACLNCHFSGSPFLQKYYYQGKGNIVNSQNNITNWKTIVVKDQTHYQSGSIGKNGLLIDCISCHNNNQGEAFNKGGITLKMPTVLLTDPNPSEYPYGYWKK